LLSRIEQSNTLTLNESTLLHHLLSKSEES